MDEAKIEEEKIENLAPKFKGRIPSGVKKEVVAYNKAKRALSVKKKPNGAIEEIPKMDLFFNAFLENGGNATEAALTVFNCSTRESAASLGSIYLKKARLLGRVYMEQKGFTYGKILEVMAGKAVEAKDPDWMDRVLKMLGYHDFISKGGPKQTVNIIQTEKDILGQYIEGDVEELEPLEVQEPEAKPDVK